MPVSPGLIQDVAALYREVDAALAAHAPVCVNRGLCCHFGRTGHRLYVTAVEAEVFAAVQGEQLNGLRTPQPGQDRCPYQVDGRCTARAARPLGCRVYFCDQAAQDWQGPLYEQFHSRLQALGERHGVAYSYRDWLAVLGEASQPRPAGPDAGPLRT